jgi:DNA uptake protein ComE-like DNA-binding protein
MLTGKAISNLKLVAGAIVLSIFAAACNSGGDNKAQVNSGTATPAAASPAAANPATATTSPGKTKLNVNNASQADLLRTIPGMGNKMVHEFEEYRPYRSIQQFRKEIGKYVTPEQVLEYEKYIFVPIDQNQSDAATLQQIPGLNAAEAQELIGGRPYASRDAFMAKLGEKVSAEELAIARTYMVEP